MIIDIHRHVWSAYERHASIREIYDRTPTKRGTAARHEELPIVPDWEARGREIIEEMDEAGVDTSVLLLADYGLRLGDSVFSVEGENRIQVELSRRYQGRLLPFFGSDPRRPGAADLFKRSLEEWGVRGLKMHPTVGYFPHDPVCHPLYKLCVEHQVPVIFHSGPMAGLLYSRFTQPLQFDDVAADFPDLTIILAHAGQDLWREALNVARMKPNVYLELSYWQYCFKHTQDFIQAIGRMRDDLGIDRIIWGSDLPATGNAMSLKTWADTFRRLPSLGEDYGVRFDDSEVTAMMGGNTERILSAAGDKR